MQQSTMSTSSALIRELEASVYDELQQLLGWWIRNMKDDKNGGFYGTVSNSNKPFDTEKGIVLNSRLLWTFSASYLQSKDDTILQMATRAFQYIEKNFADHRYGGIFWSVDAAGKMKDGRKQIYGLAFCIYGLSEYYKAAKDESALRWAKSLFQCIEQYSFDQQYGGYIEAFTREWYNAGDLRLSDKDDNEPKSMNTHLHIVEAYANLYTVWPDELLKEKIIALLNYFDRHIINKETNHLHLFMNHQWQVRSSLISFGHDIEAAWLLQECAEMIQHPGLIAHFRELALLLTDAAAEGLDAADGGLWYEYDPATNHWIREKHWWPQAEALVGFFNAYQVSGDEKYLQQVFKTYDFVKTKIKDLKHGEWFWGIEADGKLMDKEKAGFWKCPYHNGRACLELIKRIGSFSR